MEKSRHQKQHTKHMITDQEFDSLCIAIAQLPPQHRKVLILRIFYEYSIRRIAERLNIPIPKVQHHLARALEAVHATRKVLQIESNTAFSKLIEDIGDGGG